MDHNQLLSRTTELVVTYVTRNTVKAEDVPAITANIYNALYTIENPPAPVQAAAAPTKKTRRRKATASIENTPIVDEKEAEQALIEEVANDSFNEVVGETLPDEENIVGEVERAPWKPINAFD